MFYSGLLPLTHILHIVYCRNENKILQKQKDYLSLGIEKQINTKKMTQEFSINNKTLISVEELTELMNGNVCNGLEQLESEEKLWGTELVGKVYYKASFFTNKKGLNIYCQRPKIGYDKNNKKIVCYGKDFRLGTITFSK